MQYTREEYERNTRNAILCIAILTVLGMVLIWAFFEEIRPSPLLYEGPPIGEFPLPEEEDIAELTQSP